MSVESFDPVQISKNHSVEVTAAAVEHFRKQLDKDATARAVRLSVKQSGCTGFMYVVDLVPEAKPDDLHVQLANNVELLVAKDSLAIVNGTQIDLVREGVNLQLRFLNPNAKDHCGCGESFSVN
ncbi:MAG: iron-sulfur cluster assembly accessory protein [Gammaproteobacteria bacterium]|nr:iron-sulfur cluster assembly accessory protein [Gammaproteobacteria bacterium]MDP2140494.1 iron-sulfur cluster assembly accessory protein [Gammaproteobacteria bacterium]MDP2348803.1 iron-sulfur cluster assembly accessory protein [Gammaproteobacteria bacterium]